MYSIEGTIKTIRNTQQISDSFKKREFVLTDESSQYPQHISFQLTQDRCDLADEFKEGEVVKVSFYLRGREWKSPKDGELKYFNSLDVWRIERTQAEGAPPEPVNDQITDLSAEEEDDLPF